MKRYVFELCAVLGEKGVVRRLHSDDAVAGDGNLVGGIGLQST